MKMWRKLGILVLSLVFVLSFAGFSVSAPKAKVSKPVIKLKVWAPTEEQSILVTMCSNFAKLHPEATFQFTYGVMGVDKSIDAIKKDASVAADVFLYPSGGVSELTSAGLVMPISYNADSVKKENAKPAINSCSLNGVLYGVPETANSWFLYYNSSMFTKNDVKSLDTMLAKNLPTDVKNFSVDITNSWYNAAWFYGAGLNLFGPTGTEDTKCDWNSPTGVAVGNYLLNLANNPKFVNDTSSGLAGTLMKQGKLAALCSGTWSAGDLKQALGKNYAAAPLPTYTLNGKKCQLASFVDYKAFGVNAMTKYPQQAEELAEYLGSPNAQLLRFEKINAAPTDTVLFNNSKVKANIEDLALSQQTALSAPQPKSPQLSQYWSPAAALGADIVNGKVTTSTMQDELDKFVKAVTTKTTN
jgi:arabinogalactan oligomer / maltooligosaccharide transport system substrate-binding protein